MKVYQNAFMLLHCLSLLVDLILVLNDDVYVENGWTRSTTPEAQEHPLAVDLALETRPPPVGRAIDADVTRCDGLGVLVAGKRDASQRRRDLITLDAEEEAVVVMSMRMESTPLVRVVLLQLGVTQWNGVLGGEEEDVRDIIFRGGS